MNSEVVLYVVRVLVEPDVEREWDVWYANSHVPEVLRQPGFLKATKFRRAEDGGRPEYWTFFEMRSLRDFKEYTASEARKKLRAEYDAKFGKTTKLERFLLVEPSEIGVLQ